MSGIEFERATEHQEQITWCNLIYTVNYSFDVMGRCNHFQITRNETNRIVTAELVSPPESTRTWGSNRPRYWRVMVHGTTEISPGKFINEESTEVIIDEGNCNIWDGQGSSFALCLPAVRQVFGDGNGSYHQTDWLGFDKSSSYR